MLSPYISQISLLSLLWAQHMGENEAIQPEECIEGSIDSSLISPNKEQIRLSHYLCPMHASKICVRGLSLVLGPYSLWSILTMLLIFFIFCMEISRLSNIGLVSVSCLTLLCSLQQETDQHSLQRHEPVPHEAVEEPACAASGAPAGGAQRAGGPAEGVCHRERRA